MLMTWVHRDQCSVSDWLILGFEFSRASGIQSGKDTDRYIYVIIVKFFGRISGPVHTTADKCCDAAVFLRSGLLSTLIRRDKGAFPGRKINFFFPVATWLLNILKW